MAKPLVSELGVKQDAFPGKYTRLRTVAYETGQYDAVCTEFCGAGHSRMTAEVTVVDREQYDEWLADNEDEQATAPDSSQSGFIHRHLRVRSLRFVGPGVDLVVVSRVHRPVEQRIVRLDHPLVEVSRELPADVSVTAARGDVLVLLRGRPQVVQLLVRSVAL